MTNKSLCNRGMRPRATERAGGILCFLVLSVCGLINTAQVAEGDAPGWMHALVNTPLPAHDEKTDAVEMYSERIVTVQSADKIKTLVRKVYKILRPGGRDLGTVVIPFDSLTKISNCHAWRIPAHGKHYEANAKDGADVAMPAGPAARVITLLPPPPAPTPAPHPSNPRPPHHAPT